MSSKFEVKPVKQYQGALYPSNYLPDVEEELTKERPGPVKLSALIVLILAISFGLIACWGELKYKYEEPLNATLGEGDDCNTGDQSCSDNNTWLTCVDSTMEATACEDYCQEQYGHHGDVTSTGCDISAEEPCQCEYDLIAGMMYECEPPQLVCADDQTLGVCSEYYYYEYSDCDAYCQEHLGRGDAYSLGCDADAADPCLCDYDLIDGEMPTCTPGELRCDDEQTLATCQDDHTYATQNCNELCSNSDPAAVSLGCDADAADPCQCQYDIAPGVMPECLPGDITCPDEQTVAICTDDYYSVNQDCDAYCREQSGSPDAYSLGCSETNTADPCQCQYDIIDGDVASCTPGELQHCVDTENASICNDDGWSTTTVSCASYCSSTFGEDFYSIGCDNIATSNKCGCKNQ